MRKQELQLGIGLTEESEMVKEAKNLTNIRLTESDEDGIWLYFDGGGKTCGIALSTLLGHGDIANEAIEAWAREQLDKQEVNESLPPVPNNEFLKEGNEERTDTPSTFSRWVDTKWK